MQDKAQFEPLMHLIVTKSGEIKLIEEQGDTEFDETFEPVRSFGVVRDVTRYENLEWELIVQKKICGPNYRLASGSYTCTIW